MALGRGRVVGIDYGKVRVGVAVSDESRLISRPLCCLEMNKKIIEELKKQIQPLRPVDEIVMGLPLKLDGKDSPMSLEVRQFAALVEKELAIPVKLWDERLTSAQVERTLKDAGVKRKKRAQLSDVLAADLILQSYLDYKRL